MINMIKNLFKRDEDPNLTKLLKLTDGKRGVYTKLDEEEQTFLMLRLANKSKSDIAVAVTASLSRIETIEQSVIAKLSKR